MMDISCYLNTSSVEQVNVNKSKFIALKTMQYIFLWQFNALSNIIDEYYTHY